MITFELETVISQAFPAGGVNVDQSSRFEDGNVLDRLCDRRTVGVGKQLGATSCEGCVFYKTPETYAGTWEEEAKVCANQNLLTILDNNEIDAAETLMVGFTKDGIGFYDEGKTNGTVNDHKFGWQMTAGYNAYFAKTKEVGAIGGRAADCSIVKVEFTDNEGEQGYGIVHLTRANIQGDSALSYGPDGNQSFLTTAILAAAEHYGADVSTFKLTQMAKIDQLDYRFKPTTNKETGEVTESAEQAMDRLFAGWFDADMLHNLTNPDWKRGDPIDPADKWKADYQEMTEHVMTTSGVPLENIGISEAINPGIVESGHASNAAANDPNRPAERRRPDARDLYAVAVKL